MSKRIGVFDSGIGGLTVLKELVVSKPAEYIYIGDSLRAPYGNKSKEELLSHTKDLMEFLKSKGCDFFINACNSLSSLDTEPLLKELGVGKENYVDMISATREGAIKELDKDSRILIYATVATINSGAYQEVFKNFNVKTLASKNLAYAIENANQIEIDDEVDILVDEILNGNITHLFLGCTHFPLINEYLEKRLQGLSVKIIDPSRYVSDILVFNKEKLSIKIYSTKVSNSWTENIAQFGEIKAEEVLLKGDRH